ncbi:efflux RND transporter periplasmic adaptor subunit [Tardiphaga sp. vice352]|uniref:efflux RND transporter periplasmic adaptor subunit n=1 Tax=unclassified Tardiphaga TaxID=2631404 RepID=UPI001163140E|nr:MULTISPECIES: efflux RND transporter periplasmic adaptor subunit [unclassified Tardiphaga]QDM16654.1 efflux RND transporter periplasmic adaptor subunit [Tardiphaga sp. vice278]QDM21677.1 efflux RND transporter periplasmic adaptor subunit [Tardiphaga sp. vice154]QDM31928.1 efflux RND transporter periplasmic adaptor subunit [Tardiphaga sp. vice352]
MTRALLACTAAALIAVAGGGYAWRPFARVAAIVTPAAAQQAGAVLYYEDPDGKPDYSPVPKTTADGRDYRPVFAASEPEPSPTRPPASHAAPPGDRKIKYYRNPMGLADTSPVPKKDSMGMDYIPVLDGEDSDDGVVRLSLGKIQRAGVKSEPAARRVIQTVIRAPGTIQLDERRVSVISMRSESWVQKVADVTTGTRVRKGQPLMDIYSPAVASAAAEYVATLRLKTPAGEAGYGRGSRLRLINLDVPEPVIVDIEKSGAVPLAIAWTAPRDGIVLERNAIEGMRAQPGDVLFRIADVSAVWALVDVAERDLGAIAVGQHVNVRARSFTGREFAGVISVIYPQVNRDTRTARIRIELANADLALLPDMYIDAVIGSGSPDPVVAIPESAVLDSGSRQAVFVDKGEGRFEPRAVTLGRRSDGYVEIREGIDDGEPVVVSANFLIDAESNLKAALKGFSEGSAQ